MEKLTECPVCGEAAALARVRHVRPADALVVCPRCRSMYAEAQPDAGELAELYRREYYNEANTLRSGRREEEQARNRGLYRAVLRDLLRRYPRALAARAGEGRGRALDYGCGPGYFLAECREAGFQVSGIEFSEVAARYARERLNLEVATEPDLALEQLSPGSCRLVTAWQVLEHTRRPRQVLERLAAGLAPGGVLCLTVPNLRCWRHLLEGGRWFNIRNPTHLVFFTRSGLTGLLAGLGLRRIVRPVFLGGRPGFGLAASLLQYPVRLAGLGSELRLYAERPEQ